ncbi:CysZ protein [Sinobacterium caligoides]|uniref:Sulfate transporter CysZ n=1 Tax=Sinobacterium caligoides TaxID=933926 RepID=A0A3N2E0L2_9GAMM|nr:sulfate transporter CysZ [Sinobacterium caligoides]ROS05628.1 CysZ protein [Sinobacterium caligoides]
MIKGNPIKGMYYFTQGFKLLNTPGLRAYVAVPLAINILLFSSMIYWAYTQIGEISTWLVGYLPGWLAWVTWLMIPLFFIGIFFIIMYTFTAIATIIASPFNGLLSEKLEQHLTGHVSADTGWKQMMATVPRTLKREMQKLGYQIPLLIVVALLAFIPFIGMLSSPLWLLLGAWMMAIQYIDIPFDNHLQPFDSVKFSCRQHRFTSLGFGATATLLSLIPLVNLIVMPAAVCGATLFWVEQLKAENGIDPRPPGQGNAGGQPQPHRQSTQLNQPSSAKPTNYPNQRD